mmetsp:Transcript_2769/g.7698  ORF Transcript_2769/g.7698 Transcript_2769/m.7698 type:complete len:304 (-) Transcript_2769:104-1015(-)
MLVMSLAIHFESPFSASCFCSSLSLLCPQLYQHNLTDKHLPLCRAFGNTSIWPMAFTIVDLTMETQDKLGSPGIFLLVFLTCVFMPLQGAFNFIVFIWPKYQRVHKLLRKPMGSHDMMMHSVESNGDSIVGSSEMQHATSLAKQSTSSTGEMHGNAGVAEIKGDSMRWFRIILMIIQDEDAASARFSSRASDLRMRSNRRASEELSSYFSRFREGSVDAIDQDSKSPQHVAVQDEMNESTMQQACKDPSLLAEAQEDEVVGENSNTSESNEETNAESQQRQPVPGKPQSMHLLIDHTGDVKQI